MKKLLSSLLLSITLLGCNTKEQQAQKAADTKDIVDRSMQVCDVPASALGQSSYRKRLTSAFQGADTDSVKTLKNENIIVCLDNRLPAQFVEDLDVDGVFYGDAMTLALTDERYNKNKVIDDAAYRIDHGQFSAVPLYAKVRCSKGCSTSWKKETEFAGEERPALLSITTPPLKATK